MVDLSTASIREVIDVLRKRPKDGSTNSMRNMLSDLLYGALATRLEEQEGEYRDLYVALHNLTYKLEECQSHIDGAIQMAFNIRGHEYSGPNYGAEFSSAKKILNSISGDRS